MLRKFESKGCGVVSLSGHSTGSFILYKSPLLYVHMVPGAMMTIVRAKRERA